MTFHTSPSSQQKCSFPCCALHSTVMTKMHVSNLSLFFCDLVPRNLGQHPSNIFSSTCLRTAALKTSPWVKTFNCGSPLNYLGCVALHRGGGGWWQLPSAPHSLSAQFPEATVREGCWGRSPAFYKCPSASSGRTDRHYSPKCNLELGCLVTSNYRVTTPATPGTFQNVSVSSSLGFRPVPLSHSPLLRALCSVLDPLPKHTQNSLPARKGGPILARADTSLAAAGVPMTAGHM